ncbi:hypothetical protein FQN54_005469 [Arachnomyces sp. PD_36]|nr:hypothetical protein FQN54_005469 [Arachnomyces sp. PD_36]
MGEIAKWERLEFEVSVNLDFDARIPIPFSVFPSSYRSNTVSETTQTVVEGEVKEATSRAGREDTRYSAEGPLPDPRTYGKEEVDVDIHYQSDPRQSRQQEDVTVYEEDRYQDRSQDRYPQVDLSRDRYRETTSSPFQNNYNLEVDRQQSYETQIDITERDYRRRTDPTFQSEYIRGNTQVREVDPGYDSRFEANVETAPRTTREVDYEAYRPQSNVEVKSERRTVLEQPAKSKMGYYDDDNQYHSFRRGVQRAADHVLHPFNHHHHKEEVEVARVPARSSREEVRVVQPRGGHPRDTITIPCHFIRMGDLLILQGRPCQVIRISVSSQTGQHRYLGVDLFTRQLHEESSFVSNPSPSVVVQSMLGPVYKTYRILDLRDDNSLVAMTDSGDVKQGLPVVDQGGLFNRISEAFSEGRGSVRALVINDGGRELVVDYKVIHGSRL